MTENEAKSVIQIAEEICTIAKMMKLDKDFINNQNLDTVMVKATTISAYAELEIKSSIILQSKINEP